MPVLEARTLHMMTVDVEEYFQVEAFADLIPRDSWDSYPSRVALGTRRVLELLDRHSAKATFFFVGWVAERQPELVREVVERGHEIACHSHLHRALFRLTPEEFRQDLRRARAAIEDAGGQPVLGFRAPTWSIRKDTLWALDVLAEEGFAYDSSIFPVHHDLYGLPGAPRFAHVHRLAGGRTLPEFPPTTVRALGLTLPGAGGGYLRILPQAYTRFVLRRLERAEGRPAMVYVHPWEFDPEQPRLAAPWRSRLRHYTNLARMGDRLERVLEGRRFGPVREQLASLARAG